MQFTPNGESASTSRLKELGYEEVASLEERLRFHRRFPIAGISLHQWIAERIGPAFQRSRVVIEFGAGLGAFWESALRSFALEDKQLVLSDLAPTMVESLARLRQDGITVLQCDIDRLPFRTSVADLILSHSVLHYSADASNAIGALVETLSNGGTLSILVSGSGNMGELHRLYASGNYGIDLSSRPLSRFHEPQADVALLSRQYAVTKQIYVSTMQVDDADSIGEYFLSHPEIRASDEAEEIREDLVLRAKRQMIGTSGLLVTKRQCLYVVGARTSSSAP